MIRRRSSDEWASKIMRACVVLCEMQLLADCCWSSNTFTYPTPSEAPKPFEVLDINSVGYILFNNTCLELFVSSLLWGSEGLMVEMLKASWRGGRVLGGRWGGLVLQAGALTFVGPGPQRTTCRRRWRARARDLGGLQKGCGYIGLRPRGNCLPFPGNGDGV